MKQQLLSLAFILLSSIIYAQIGIGTTSPDPSSILEVQSTTKGFLAPRINLSSVTNSSIDGANTNAAGLLIYNTNASVTGGNGAGYYYWDGSIWVSMKGAASGAGWQLDGNSIASGDFLGTTNNFPLEIKVNNVLKTRITSRGQIEALNTSNSVYLGELAGANSYATSANNIFIGYGSDYDHSRGASNSVILGYNSRVSSDNSIVIGSEADADSNNSIAIGRSTESQGTYGIVIGDDAYTNRTAGTAIGRSSQAQGEGSISIGRSSYTSGTNAIAIGSSAQSQAANTVAIGNGVYASYENTMILGNNLNIGIGTNNPQTRLHVAGGFRLANGSQAAGRVLTSNANGDATWVAPSNSGDSDWFEANSTNAPDAISDNIYTNGNVGIGLNNPNAPLHIYEATGTPPSGNDGTIVLQHGNTNGTSSIVFMSRNNTNSDYGYISYADDGSGNGSEPENALLTIGIENDVPGQWQDDINISSTGNVGISSTAPSKKLHVNVGDRDDDGLVIDQQNFDFEIELDDSNNDRVRFNNTNNAGQFSLGFNDGNQFIWDNNEFYPVNNRIINLGRTNNRWDNFYVDNIFYAGATQDSDKRLKKNIVPLYEGLKTVQKLKSYSYNFKKGNTDKLHYGFIAQEIIEILPDLVSVSDGEEKLMGVNYIEVIPILVTAVQEQQEQIEYLQKQVSELEQLKAEFAALKAMVLENTSKASGTPLSK